MNIYCDGSQTGRNIGIGILIGENKYHFTDKITTDLYDGFHELFAIEKSIDIGINQYKEMTIYNDSGFIVHLLSTNKWKDRYNRLTILDEVIRLRRKIKNLNEKGYTIKIEPMRNTDEEKLKFIKIVHELSRLYTNELSNRENKKKKSAIV